MAKHKDWKQDKELLEAEIDMLEWDIRNNNKTIKGNLLQNKRLREQTLLIKRYLAEHKELLAKL